MAHGNRRNYYSNPTAIKLRFAGFSQEERRVYTNMGPFNVAITVEKKIQKLVTISRHRQAVIWLNPGIRDLLTLYKELIKAEFTALFFIKIKIISLNK
jgi:hypothetical protein